MNFNINDKSWITLLQATNPFHKQEYFNQLNSLIDADKHDERMKIMAEHENQYFKQEVTDEMLPLSPTLIP